LKGVTMTTPLRFAIRKAISGRYSHFQFYKHFIDFHQSKQYKQFRKSYILRLNK